MSTYSPPSPDEFEDRINFLAGEIVKLKDQLNVSRRIVNRLPLCSDHRDKIRDRCVECGNEELQKALYKALIIMRNYYAGAIPRRFVDEFVEKYTKLVDSDKIRDMVNEAEFRRSVGGH